MLTHLQPNEAQSPAIDEPLETPQTFAKLVRVTPQTVRNWIRDDVIQCVICTGKIMRFRRSDALAALAGQPKPAWSKTEAVAGRAR